jgi:YHS domain-containing protein
MKRNRAAGNHKQSKRKDMKLLKTLAVALLVAGALSVPILSRAEDAKKADQAKAYPLTTCVVSGEKLGEMGKPMLYSYKGREIKFCCPDCQKDFDKDPAKFIKKLDEADAKAKK